MLIKPTDLGDFATGEATTTHSAQTVTAVTYQGLLTEGAMGWALVRYQFGAINLSAVLQGFVLQVDGCSFEANNGSFEIHAVSDAGNYVDIKSPLEARVGAALNESSITASADILDDGPRILKPGAAHRAQGARAPQKFADGWLNWALNKHYNALKTLMTAWDGAGKIARRIVAGDNIGLTDTKIVDSLVVSAVDHQENITLEGVRYGVVRYQFGSVNLSSVTTDHLLSVSGCGESANNGVFPIKAVSDASNYIDVYTLARFDTSDDETGITGAAYVTDGTQTISANLTVTQVPSIGETFTQSSHGFALGTPVRHNGTTWVNAQGTTITGSTDVWVVVAAPTVNTFIAVKSGRYTLAATTAGVGSVALVAGELLYLSTTAGGLTTVRPVGSPSQLLGFYLPLIVVESVGGGSAVIHVLGNSYPTLDPLLAEWIVSGSNADGVTFTIPGFATHASYRAEFDLLNQSGGAQTYYASLNGESGSGSDYWRQGEFYNNTTTGIARNQGSKIAQAASNGALTAGSVDFRRGPSMGYVIQSRAGSIGSSQGSEEEWFSTNSRYLTSDATSITFWGGTTSMYGVGSAIRLYRGRIS